MQAAAQAASEFVLSTEVKVSAVQQLFEADKALALAAEHDIRAKKETECSTALKVRWFSQVLSAAQWPLQIDQLKLQMQF